MHPVAPTVHVALSLALLATAFTAGAQAPARVPMVGVLSPGPAATPLSLLVRDALERGLKEHGWTPGQTIRLEYRYAEGSPGRLEALARDLVRLGVDVLVARASNSVRAAKQATTTIPIVMSASGVDPVEAGFVASLGRPGGNITGLALLTQNLPVKQLELLKEVLPRLSRVAVLCSRDAALTPRARQGLDTAAQALGLQLHYVDVRGPDDLDPAFAEMARARANGLLARADPLVLEANVSRIVALALKHRLSAVFWFSGYVQAGGLMSYGPDIYEIHRRSASYVDRILRGARPADLPVEEPTKLVLVVNLKTARALELTIPPSIQARANEVIQ